MEASMDQKIMRKTGFKFLSSLEDGNTKTRKIP